MLLLRAIACYVLSVRGLAVARTIAQYTNIVIFAPQHLIEREGLQGVHAFSSLPTLLTQTFFMYKAHIFICATGIAVRCIAQHIQHKGHDPAVIVCDEKGLFSISLLSGHWGGGNALAKEIAVFLEGQAVITTATDIYTLPAVDILAKEKNCVIIDWDKIKYCNTALLAHKKVYVYDPLCILGVLPATHFTAVPSVSSLTSLPSVAVHWRTLPAFPECVRLAVPCVYVGIGCKRDVAQECLDKAVRQCLKEADIAFEALAGVASVDKKADEKGLIGLAKEFALPLYCYSAESLAEVTESRLSSVTPSLKAAEIFHLTHISVCEAAALSAVGKEAVLIVPKKKYYGQITLALAIAETMLS